MNEDFFKFLNLRPLSQIENYKLPVQAKRPKDLIKFLRIIPFTTVFSNPNYSLLKSLYKDEKCGVTRDFESFINSQKHLQINEPRAKRKTQKFNFSTKNNEVKLKNLFKKCEVIVNRFSFNKILQIKISKETRNFIQRYTKKHDKIDKSIGEEVETIYVEAEFRKHSSQTNTSNNENISCVQLSSPISKKNQQKASKSLPLRSIINSCENTSLDLTGL
ncbi:unnamed protein product [Brachionus calyciflorus]|uniref:Uncharacterized protein n=1 Tax=Brachionus calyciflorus TaxID=104777 RepID=A0A813MCU5_9BILA|nr:unnamed protein product [Brachionus calyciflorus]